MLSNNFMSLQLTSSLFRPFSHPRSRRFIIGVLLVRAKKKNRLFFTKQDTSYKLAPVWASKIIPKQSHEFQTINKTILNRMPKQPKTTNHNHSFPRLSVLGIKSFFSKIPATINKIGIINFPSP